MAVLPNPLPAAQGEGEDKDVSAKSLSPSEAGSVSGLHFTVSSASILPGQKGKVMVKVSGITVESGVTPAIPATKSPLAMNQKLDPSPHPSPLGGERVSEGRVRGASQRPAALPPSKKKVTTAQFSLRWDPAVLKFEGIGEFGLATLAAGNFNMALASEGKLAVSWDDPKAAGEDLADGANLFSLEFTAVGTDGTRSAVELTDIPTVREVTVNFEPARFEPENGAVNVGTATPAVEERPVLSIDLDGTIRVSGTAGRSYRIEYVSELRETNEWVAVGTVTLTNTSGVLVDPQMRTGNTSRFYRAVLVP